MPPGRQMRFQYRLPRGGDIVNRLPRNRMFAGQSRNRAVRAVRRQSFEGDLARVGCRVYHRVVYPQVTSCVFGLKQTNCGTKMACGQFVNLT